MANELASFNPTAIPAHARTESALMKALTGGAGATSKRISIEGGVFRLIAGGKEVAAIPDRHLDVVLVAAAPHISRTFYMSTFVKGQAAAPDCWSADGERPDESAKNKQSDRCATCPQNVKGSGQGESRACRFNQRLAVVLANDLEGDVLQFTASATTIFGKEDNGNRPLQAYARWLAAQSINSEALVTRMKFDLNATAPKLFFEPVRWLNADEFAICQEKGQSDAAKQAVTLTVAQTDGVPAPAMNIPGTPPAGATAPKAAPKAVAKAKVEEPAAEEPEEPAKRKEAPAATAPKKPTNLAAVISDWFADDE
jgi:hypothetical protein